MALELGRLTGTCEVLPYAKLDTNESCSRNELSCPLTDTEEIGDCEEDSAIHPYSMLDPHNLQFLRLCTESDISGSPCWETKMFQFCCQSCKSATRSQSFYTSSSAEQWLRTVTKPKEHNKPRHFHSNILPRKAYLTKLRVMQRSCSSSSCTAGFFPSSALREGKRPYRRCGNCALAEHFGRDSGESISAGAGPFWYIEDKDVTDVTGHASLNWEGSQAFVSKILWQNGVFARKTFKFGDQTPNTTRNVEVDVALTVSHPNIVHCFGFSKWNDHSGFHGELFMELLEGDLEMLLMERDRGGLGPLSFQELQDVLLQVAEAMNYVHEMNFVHGDLKTANILVSELPMLHASLKFYLVKVADFGCAQEVHPGRAGATVKPFNAKIGSRLYVAPEVLRCRENNEAPECPKKIDVYSFGVVAYQLLTGLTAGSFSKVTRKGVLKPDGDLTQWRPTCVSVDGTLECVRSKDLLALIQRCWSSSPDRRPDFNEIRQELREGVRDTHCSFHSINHYPMKKLGLFHRALRSIWQ